MEDFEISYEPEERKHSPDEERGILISMLLDVLRRLEPYYTSYKMSVLEQYKQLLEECKDHPLIIGEMAKHPDILKARLVTDDELVVDHVEGLEDGEVSQMALCDDAPVGEVIEVRSETSSKVGLVITPDNIVFTNVEKPTSVFKQGGSYRTYDDTKITAVRSGLQWIRPHQLHKSGRKLIRANGVIYELDTDDMHVEYTAGRTRNNSLKLRVIKKEKQNFKYALYTSNKDKSQIFEYAVERMQLVPKVVNYEFQEIQGTAREIAVHKYKCALSVEKGPVIIVDTSLSCVEYGGLPGPYLGYWLWSQRNDLTQAIRNMQNRNAWVHYTVVYGIDESNYHVHEETIPGKLMLRKMSEIEGLRGIGPWFKPQGSRVFMSQMDAEQRLKYSPWVKVLSDANVMQYNSETGSSSVSESLGTSGVVERRKPYRRRRNQEK